MPQEQQQPRQQRQQQKQQRVRGVAEVVQTMACAARRAPTPAEEVLWQALRGGKLDGLKFRRQHPLGSFMLDFCCPSLRLVVEADGGIHAAQLEQDAARTAHLAAYGYHVLRFPNAQILSDLPAVLTTIHQTAQTLLSTPPLPELGEGAGG